MNETVFTPASVLSLLVSIDELSDKDISLTETFDGKLQLAIGDSIYELVPDTMNEIEVDLEIVEEVEDINSDTYSDLGDAYDIVYDDSLESVESGILKEVAKSLLLGGMVRLSAKLLTK